MHHLHSVSYENQIGQSQGLQGLSNRDVLILFKFSRNNADKGVRECTASYIASACKQCNCDGKIATKWLALIKHYLCFVLLATIDIGL